MTSRIPRHDLSDLAVSDDAAPTLDNEPVGFARGSADRSPIVDPYFDAGKDDPEAPQNVDLAARVTALERADKRKARRKTFAQVALGVLAGSGASILVWALARADANGDARATAREREAERVWMRESVRLLLDHDAKREGQIEMLQDRLRYYPVHGPATQGTTP